MLAAARLAIGELPEAAAGYPPRREYRADLRTPRGGLGRRWRERGPRAVSGCRKPRWPQTPNQALQQTAGACRLFQSSQLTRPPPLLSWVVRRRRAKRGLQVHPHLALVAIASLALSGATAYFLLVIPRRLTPSDPDWLAVGSSWATAFVAQVGVYLAVVCPVAAHALSGRWSWSVRVFTAVSVYAGLMMATLALNAYEDVKRASGHVRSPAEFLEGAFILSAAFVFYLLLFACTLSWIATRGRRFRRGVKPN